MSECMDDQERQELGRLVNVLEAVRRGGPSEAEWQSVRRRVGKRLQSHFLEPLGRPLAAKISWFLWGGGKAKLVTISASAILLLGVIAGIVLTVPPQVSLAEVIVTTLKSPFHAVRVGPGCDGEETVWWEIYSKYPRTVVHRQGKPVEYNDGQRTWVLDQKPPVVRYESPDRMFARLADLSSIIVDSPPKGAQSYKDVFQMPDSVLDGTPVHVWKVSYHMRHEVEIKVDEVLVEKSTNRILRVDSWDVDYQDKNKDGDWKDLHPTGTLRISYNEVISDSVFEVDLPTAAEVRDLASAQDRLQDSPGFVLMDTPDFRLEIRHFMVGPGGEFVFCEMVQSKTDEDPPNAGTHFSDEERRQYADASFCVSGLSPPDGVRLRWECHFPKDIAVYLDRFGKAQALLEKTYTFRSYEFTHDLHEEHQIQPQGTFTVEDYEEKIRDVILASGFSYIQGSSYPDLLEEIARMGTLSCKSLYKGEAGINKVENYLRWLLRYRDLTVENGHPERFSKTINDLVLNKSVLYKQWIASPLYSMIEGPTQRILEAHEKGEMPSLEDIPYHLTETQGPWAGHPILGVYEWKDQEKLRVHEAFEGPMGEIVLGMEGSPDALDTVEFHWYGTRCYKRRPGREPPIGSVEKNGQHWKIFMPFYDVLGKAPKRLGLSYLVPYQNELIPEYIADLYSFPVQPKSAEEMDAWLREINEPSLSLNYGKLKEKMIEKQLLASYSGKVLYNKPWLKYYEIGPLWQEYTALVRTNGTYKEAIERFENLAAEEWASLKEREKDKSDIERIRQLFEADLEAFKKNAAR